MTEETLELPGVSVRLLCADVQEALATLPDPFGGAGTTAIVAASHLRNSICIELNPAYIAIARRRILAGPKKDRRGAYA